MKVAYVVGTAAPAGAAPSAAAVPVLTGGPLRRSGVGVLTLPRDRRDRAEHLRRHVLGERVHSTGQVWRRNKNKDGTYY